MAWRMKLAICGATRWTRVLPMMIPILKVLFDVIVIFGDLDYGLQGKRSWVYFILFYFIFLENVEMHCHTDTTCTTQILVIRDIVRTPTIRTGGQTGNGRMWMR